MIKSVTKSGRPKAVYRAANGDQIVGLYKLKDGRWRISGKEKITFSEADEQLAIARFHKLRAGVNSDTVSIPKATAKLTDDGALRKAILFVGPEPRRGGKLHGTFLPPGLELPPAPVASKGVIRVELRNDDELDFITDQIQAAAFYAWLRRIILTRPAYLAERTGIEQLAYLGELKKPTPSPTMKELIDTYTAKVGLSDNERSRSIWFWREFTKAVGCDRVADIGHTNIEDYEKLITGGCYSAKSALHRIAKIRTVLNYAIKRGKGIEHCRRALDIAAMLDIKEHTPLDPRPITPAQFWAVHAAAEKAGDQMFAALMLVSLNAAMYSGELAALKWDEVDLKTRQLVTRRPKTGVSRIAILWPETVAALKKLPRERETVFTTPRRSATSNSILKSWRQYREAAGFGPDLVFSQLRDASFSIASGISLEQARLIAGHRLSGASDHYLRRHPEKVADACAAIRQGFFQSSGIAKRPSHR